jgi:hypothetical protein
MGQAYAGIGSEASLDCFLGSNLGPLVLLAGEDGEDTMESRALILQTLQTAVLAGLSGSPTATILEAVRHELNRSVSDNLVTADVDE